jgi:hypothetical protein
MGGREQILTADFDERVELDEVGLADKELLGGGAEPADLWVGERRPAPSGATRRSFSRWSKMRRGCRA